MEHQNLRTLTLVKDIHQFCFWFEIGQESLVLDALVDLVNRGEYGFDWFDAAVLSQQLGQQLKRELKEYIPKTS